MAHAVEPPSPPHPTALDDETERNHDSARSPRSVDQPHAHLRVFRGLADLVYRVAARGTTIGRAGDRASAEVRVDDARTSRSHAHVAFDGTGWTITDTSRNGTFVDGAALTPGSSARLAHGSVIRVGDTVAVLATDLLDEPDVAEPSFFPGLSAAALRVRRRVDVLARGSGHVLVLGETGTGKERVARQLGGAGRPFVAVNCGEPLARAGPRRAVRPRQGRYTGVPPGATAWWPRPATACCSSTSSASCPSTSSPSLLRFLEDGCYRPVGAAEPAREPGPGRRRDQRRSRPGRAARHLPPRPARPAARVQPAAVARRRCAIARTCRAGSAASCARSSPSSPAVPCDAGALECLLLFPWPQSQQTT